ncbi:hypothetical protein ACWGOQ_0020825 [Aquimarina sp. M1]
MHSLQSQNATPIEVGATWISPQHSELIILLKELKLRVFEQFIEGVALFEPSSTAAPQEVRLQDHQQPSYRIQKRNPITCKKTCRIS